MQVDAIIFDKDGTLLDFDAFWVSVSEKAIGDLFAELGVENFSVCEALEAFGVHNGVTDIDGLLCKGTYEQMGQRLYEILCEKGYTFSCEEMTKALVASYRQSFAAGDVKPSCPTLAAALKEFKRQNKKLAVVTTDDEAMTQKSLRALGIEDLFVKIYTDDGQTPTKPDPYCAFDFCRLMGVPKERVVMVGDTMTDVNFAKNAGIKVIALARNDKQKAILAPYADGIITAISELRDILE